MLGAYQSTSGRSARHDEVRSFVAQHVRDHRNDLTRLVSEHFGISRQAAGNHIRRMVTDQELTSFGRTRSQTVLPVWSQLASVEFSVTARPMEDQVWRSAILPVLPELPASVRRVLNYGFSEIFNNAVEHSEGTALRVTVLDTLGWIQLIIRDDGVGIFRKIQTELGLVSPADAVLELRKGKFTTDPRAHTGEGIFFTSRACDMFSIFSRAVSWVTRAGGRDMVFENQPGETVEGTSVILDVRKTSGRSLDEVVAAYSEDFQFDRTEVPVLIATMGSDEFLVSRSAARRIVMRLERFRQVMLDFDGVNTIGQAFADEIFRVFANDHPEVRLLPVNTTRQVARMIERATANRDEPTLGL